MGISCGDTSGMARWPLARSRRRSSPHRVTPGNAQINNTSPTVSDYYPYFGGPVFGGTDG